MTSDDCRLVEAVAEELALGVLTGADRGAALAHLDECHRCRAEVASLAEVADTILLLAPTAPPDAGFDQRVLARIRQAAADRYRDSPGDAAAPPPAARRRSQGARLRAIVAVAAALFALVAGSMLWAGHRSAPSPIAADMIDGRGERVGRVSLVADHGTEIAMGLPGWSALASSYGEPPGDRVRLELALDNGTRRWIELPDADDGTWRVRTAIEPSDIARVALTSPQGQVWCQARFA